MKRLLTIFLSLFLFTSLQTFAQHEETSILIDARLSMPMGDYGETIGANPEITRRFGYEYGDQVGLAQLGYGLGIELHTPIFTNHLSWVISAQFILNPTNDSDVNSYFSDIVDDTTNLSIETGNWFHIPVLTGFSYGLKITDGLNLYVSAQGGINITQQASREATVNNVLVEETTFDTEIDFGYSGGISIELYDKYNIGVHYLNLGQPRYEGNRRLDVDHFNNAYQTDNPIFGDERTIQMLLISLGYRL